MAAAAHRAPVTNSETDRSGAYVRHAAKHQGRIAATDVESDRYHLYVSLACPWASGALSALFLHGLDGAVGHSVVHPTWQATRPADPADAHAGWAFRAPGDPDVSSPAGHGSIECDDALVPDTVHGASTIRELYELGGDTTGPFSTPLLWDMASRTIVSNESTVILRILTQDLAPLARHPVEIYPADAGTAEAVDRLNAELVYPKVNNGVYRAGFARSQAAYDKGVAGVFEGLDKLEEILEGQRFLGGDSLSWLDVRLYHTLVRFDPIYTTYFKTNAKRLSDYPNLLAFTRDVYAIEAMRRSTNLKHAKTHYYTSHPRLNALAIIPIGDGPDLTAPHARGPAESALKYAAKL